MRAAEIVGTLIGNPDVSVMKGFTPRGAGRLVIAEGVRFQKLSTEVEAFACAHLTQMGVPGQRTGRVNRTQNASGARA